MSSPKKKKAIRLRMSDALPVDYIFGKMCNQRMEVGAAAGFFVAFVSALAGVKS